VTGACSVDRAAGRPQGHGPRPGFRDALITGVAQGLAVVPGISRSGATIAALLWRGASADLAPRLSFLMYLLVSAGVASSRSARSLEADLAWGRPRSA
jgi:undecaprenyl-diphosphatase